MKIRIAVLIALICVSPIELEASRHSNLSELVPKPTHQPHEVPHQEGEHDHGEHAEDEHAEHDGHADDAAHADHAHHHPGMGTTEAMSLSIFLMGFVTFILALFYLVNHKDKDIVASTWRTLNMTISIFAAVLIYGMFRAFIIDLLTLAGVEMTAMVTTTVCLSMYLALYIVLQVILFKVKDYTKSQQGYKLHAVGEIAAHVTGFAAMFGFVGLLDIEPFKDNSAMTLVVLLITVVTMCSLARLADIVRGKVAMAEAKEQGRTETDEKEELWLEVVAEAEDDVVCLSVSFVLTAVVRAIIRGKHVAYNPAVEPLGITQSQVWMLFAYGTGFMVLALVVAKLRGTVPKDEGLLRRWLKNIMTSIAMASSWCYLFWADWQLYAFGFSGSRIASCLIIALFLTFVAIGQVFIIDTIADNLQKGKGQRTLRFLVVAIGVLVGFAWEKTFDIAMEEIAHSGRLLGWTPGFATHVLAIALLVVILPAWYKYILKKSIELQDAMGEDELF